MNDKLLLKRKINFPNQHIGFLNFIHPNFEFVNDLSTYDNPNPIGLIYTGEYSENIESKLSSITDNWIIVNSHHFDDDLSTNEGLFKALLPIHYVKYKKNGKNVKPIYNEIDYASLLEKIKLCLLDNCSITLDSETDNSVYSLFVSILSTPDVLNRVYFNTVNKNNVNMVASSILSFLNKVQSQQINSSMSVHYVRLISQSYKRYGKKIKKGILDFVKSNSNLEISLYRLLSFLNKG